MKMNEYLLNGWIGDNNVRYDTKTGRYTTRMSYMNELSEIARPQKI